MEKYRKSSIYASNKGFTLIEVLVIVVILGIMASLVIPRIMSRPEQARQVKVKQDILAIQSALDLYKLDNGFYPTTDQGLQALVTKPSSSPVPHNWKADGYLTSVPKDPWGEPYQYLNEDHQIKIFSYGSEGKEGNSIIGNWDATPQDESV